MPEVADCSELAGLGAKKCTSVLCKGGVHSTSVQSLQLHLLFFITCMKNLEKTDRRKCFVFLNVNVYFMFQEIINDMGFGSGCINEEV